MLSASNLNIFKALALFAALAHICHAHSMHFESADQVMRYRRAYQHKNRDLHSRCGEQIQRRRVKRALALKNPHLDQHYFRRVDSADGSTATNSSTCLLTPEVTQGPYHVLGELVQQDIRGGQAGIPLHLVVDFVDVDTCEPIPNAWVDVWSANATGTYSGYASAGSGGGGAGGGGSGNSSASGMPGGGSSSINDTIATISDIGTSASLPTSTASASAPSSNSTSGGTAPSSGDGGGGGASAPTDGDNFLRGVWRTDTEGVLTMFSIVPGWYSGRAPHIHMKVYDESQGYRADNGSFIANATSMSSHHTGQWFFDDDLMTTIAALSPYVNNSEAWANATHNADDNIYPESSASDETATMDITYINATDIQYGLIASTVVGVNLTYVSSETTTAYWDPSL